MYAGQYDSCTNSYNRVMTVVADGPVPVWRQNICNHHADVHQSVDIRTVPTNAAMQIIGDRKAI